MSTITISYSILQLALKMRRINDDEFEVESETEEGKFWRPNIRNNTCRDRDGRGCLARFYSKTNSCKHLGAANIAVNLTNQWSPPYGN